MQGPHQPAMSGLCLLMRTNTIQTQCCCSALQLDGSQCGADDMLLECLVHVRHGRRSHLWTGVSSALLAALGLERLCVLGGDDNSVHLHRLNGAICLLLVLNGDLPMAIWAQPPQRAVLAHVSQDLAKLGGNRVSPPC